MSFVISCIPIVVIRRTSKSSSEYNWNNFSSAPSTRLHILSKSAHSDELCNDAWSRHNIRLVNSHKTWAWIPWHNKDDELLSHLLSTAHTGKRCRQGMWTSADKATASKMSVWKVIACNWVNDYTRECTTKHAGIIHTTMMHMLTRRHQCAHLQTYVNQPTGHNGITTWWDGCPKNKMKHKT